MEHIVNKFSDALMRECYKSFKIGRAFKKQRNIKRCLVDRRTNNSEEMSKRVEKEIAKDKTQ
jgi:hypothetical protein